jgi:hypothetical protein
LIRRCNGSKRSGTNPKFDGSSDGKTLEEIILTGYSMSVQRST